MNQNHFDSRLTGVKTWNRSPGSSQVLHLRRAIPEFVCPPWLRPGHRLRSALNLGEWRGRFLIDDQVGVRSPDVFKFRVRATSTLALEWTNRSTHSITGTVLNDRGQPLRQAGAMLGRTVPPGEFRSFWFNQLQPGTYYVRITGGGQGSEYSMALALV